MSKIMRQRVASAVDITTTGIKAATVQKLNKTPRLGGKGASAFRCLLAAVGGAGVVKIQGHNGTANGTDQPADADAGWFDVESLTSASELKAEIELPLWFRVNVTTAGTGTVTIDLDGVQ